MEGNYQPYDYNKRNKPKFVKKKKPDDEEKTPLLEGGAKSAKSNRDSEMRNDYIENRKFYCCYTAKCSIIFFGIALLINICFECYEVHLIFENAHFGAEFGAFYFIFIMAMIGAFIVVFIYWVTPDRAWSRAMLPWAFLVAAIACALLFAWICIYIEAIYGREVVLYLPRWQCDKGNDPAESGTTKHDEETEYFRMSKSNYLVTHCGAIIMFIVYLGFFFIAQDWVKAHER